MSQNLSGRKWIGLLLLFVGTYAVSADVPQIINFQGRLTDSNNNPSSGSTDFTFRFYDQVSGGTQLPAGSPYSENQTLTVTNGVFNAQIGSVTPIPFTVFGSTSVFLEITVEGETLAPRETLLTSPFAVRAYSLSGRTYDTFVDTFTAQDINGIKTYSSFPQKSGSTTPTLPAEFTTKAYVDGLSAGNGVLSSTNTWTAQQTFQNEITVSTNLVVSGPLIANGSVGSNGQVLQSQGPGLPPTWAAAGGASALLNSTNTWTANQIMISSGGLSITYGVVAGSFTGLGTDLTNLTGSNIVTGIASTVLPSTVAYTSVAQTWTAAQTFQNPTTMTSSLTVTNAASLGAAGQAVTISSNLVISGALIGSNNSGTNGQILQSQGPGAAPTWINPASASTLLSSTNTWTAQQTFQNQVTISTTLVVSSGTINNFTVGSSIVLPAQSVALNALAYGVLPTGVVASSLTVNSVYPAALQSGVYPSITGVGSQVQSLSMNSHQINSVLDPTGPQDAATKNYVDVLVYGNTNYIHVTNSLQANSTFYVSSGTIQNLNVQNTLRLAGLAGASGQVLQSNGPGAVPTWVDPAAASALLNSTNTWTANQIMVSSGGLNVTYGVVAGSVTANDLTASQFVKTDANKKLVSAGLVPGDIPGGATSYIHLRDTLQAGSTYYVSSGTANTLYVRNLLSAPTTVSLGAAANAVTVSSNAYLSTIGGAVGIGTTAPESILDVVSDGGSIIFPRKSGTGDPATGVNGMIYYNAADAKFRGYQNNSWNDLITNAATDVILEQDTLQAGATFYVSSGTVNHFNIQNTLRLSGLAGNSGEIMRSNGVGAVPTWTTVSSVLPANVVYTDTDQTITGNKTFTSSVTVSHIGGVNATYGVVAGSVTANDLTGSMFVKTDGNKKLVSAGLVPGDIPGGATSYVQLRDTLQAGSTYYVSSGTINNLNIQNTLRLAGLAGNSGQVLQSNGAGSIPTWVDPAAASALLNSTNTWTAAQNFISSVTVSSTVALGVAGHAVTISSNLVMGGGLIGGNDAGASGQLLQSQGPGAAPIWVNPGSANVLLNSTNTWTAGQTFISSITFSSTVVTGNGAGTSGQVLQSNGAGSAPTWVDPAAASALLNSTNTWTAYQTFENQVVVSTNLVVNTGTLVLSTSATLGASGYAITISSNLVLGGAVIANNSSGSNGQVLQSQGPGTTPTWVSVPGANTLLSTTNTWTAQQTFQNEVTVSTNLVVNTGTLSAPTTVNLGAASQAVTVSSNAYLSTVGGSVGIGTTVPESILDVVADGGSIIFPRKSGSGDPATGVNGMIYYNAADAKFRGYQNNAWNDLITNAATDVILEQDTLQAGATFYVSSGTVNHFNIQNTLRLAGLAGTSGQVLRTNGAGSVPTWTDVSTLLPANVVYTDTDQNITGNKTFASSVTVTHIGGINATYGVVAGSVTANDLTASQFVKTDGNKKLVSAGLVPGDIPGGATSYIQLRDTLQAGATFYVSSGAVLNNFTVAGNMGIGTQTPGTKLHLLGAANTLRVAYDGASYGDIYSDNFGALHMDSSTGLIVMEDDLRVVGNDLIFLGSDSNGKNVLSLSGDNTYLSAPGTTVGGNLIFRSSSTNTERMRISSTGNIGVSNANPATKLHLSSGTFTIDGGTGSMLVSGGGGITSTYGLTGGSLTLTGDAPVSINGSVGASGQILQSNGAGSAPTWVDPSGASVLLNSTNTWTANQVMISSGGLAVTYGVVAGSVTANDLNASQFVKTDTNKKLVSATIVSGDLPANVVYTDTDQTISGNKTFTSSVTVSHIGGVAATYGVVAGSVTANDLTGSMFVKTDGNKKLVSAGLVPGDIPGGATSYIQLTETLQAGSSYYVSSGTINNFNIQSTLRLAGLAGNSGQVLRSNGAGAVPTWVDPASASALLDSTNTWTANQLMISSGGLNVTYGVVAGSVTANDLTASQFVKTDANKKLVSAGLVPGDIPGGATSYIQLSSTLQSGATFFVSSGTVQNNLFVRGNLGVNIASPQGKLDIGHSGAATLIRFSDVTGAYHGSIDADSSGNSSLSLAAATQNTQVRFDSNGPSYINNGNLGIGITAPISKVHISSGSLRIDGNTGGIIVSAPSISTFTYGVVVGSLTANDLTASQFVKTDTNKKLVSATIVSGDLPANVVYTDTDQTITGNKTFTSSITVSHIGGIAATYGVVAGSVTANDLTGSMFVKTDGNKKLVSAGLVPGDIPGGATSYIQLRDTLQSGASFYVSSGTVNDLNIQSTLRLAGLAGSSGEILRSNGAGAAPTWVNAATAASALLNSSNTWTAQQTLNNKVDVINPLAADAYSFRASTSVNNYSLVVATSGNVGINVQNPTARLHMLGNLQVDTGNIVLGQVASYLAMGSFATQFNTNRISMKYGTNENLVVMDSGNVGIGTIAPSSKLHVASGTFRVDGGTGAIVVAGGGGITSTFGVTAGSITITGDTPMIINGSAGSSGQILQSNGSGSAPTWVPAASAGTALLASTNTWTANQIMISSGGLAVTYGVVAGSVTANDLTASQFVKTDSNKKLVSATIASGDLPSNVVYTDTDQTISGNKTFTSSVTVTHPGGVAASYGIRAATATLSLNSTVVANPGYMLDVMNANGVQTVVRLLSHGANSSMTMQRANGTAASPSAVGSGDILGSFAWAGYGATGYSTNRAALKSVATEDWSDAAQGTAFAFFTNANGAAVAGGTERMRIGQDGYVGIAISTPTSLLHMSSGTLTVDGNAGGIIVRAPAGITSNFGVTAASLTISGDTPLIINGSAGSSGQVLQSNGSGAAPTWVAGGSGLLNSTNTWTAPQTFTSSTTFSSHVYVNNGSLSVSNGQLGSTIKQNGNSGSGTVTIDWSTGNTQHVVLNGTPTFAFTNGVSGRKYVLVLKQDGSGGRTVSWPGAARFPGGVNPVLTQTASKSDYIAFMYNDVDSTYDNLAYTLNY